MAAGIETLVSCGMMPSTAAATAEFCQKVKNIFDIFNADSVKGPVCLRNCVTSGSKHLGVVKTLQPWIQSWKFVDRTGKDCSSRIKCVKGLLCNVAALNMFVDYVLDGSNLYLFTRKINQDPLENLFSVIRHKGGFCTNPSPRQFCAAFNNCALSKLLNTHNVCMSNCEGIDWGKAIVEVKSTPKLHVSPLLAVCDISSVMSLPNVEVPSDLGEANSMRYVFGFVLKKLLTVHDCYNCRTVLVDGSQELNASDKAYCYFKSYEGKFGSLFICTDNVRDFLTECESDDFYFR